MLKNVELSEIEIAVINQDARPAFALENVQGADLFHLKTPSGTPAVELRDCKDVNALWVRGVKDGPVAAGGL